MAKKVLPKAQPGRTMSAIQEQQAMAQMQANMNAANQAALENVRKPAVNRYDPDIMYAASKADSDAKYAENLAKFRSKNRSRFSDTAKKAVKNLASKLSRSKTGGAITDMGKLQAYYKNKK
jgi:hypothetical protein